MKPIASSSRLALPVAAGLAGLPLWMDAPLWAFAANLGAAGWAYSVWRREIGLRPAAPELEGQTFAPLDVSIRWRTASGQFPAARRGWKATVTEIDLWLLPVAPINFLGGNRDYVRIPLLDIVECALATETELRLRFLDDEGRAQEIRLGHVPRASELAAALGHEGNLGSKISDLG